MGEFRQILVSVDFSDPSIKALEAAVELGEQLNAELRILYVADMDAPEAGATSEGVSIESKLLDSLCHDLDEFTRNVAIDKVSFTTHVQHGEAEAVIISAAKEMQVDMIIIGTHGRTGLDHILMGSVAENVLRVAEIPVLCVRA